MSRLKHAVVRHAVIGIATLGLMLAARTGVAAQSAGAQPPAAAPDSRTELPPLLRHATLGIDVGLIDYRFSAAQLQPGFRARTVSVPHAAGSVLLLGREFSPRLSAHVRYLRAVKFVRYDDINEGKTSDSVWVVSALATLQTRWPVSERLSVTAEAGIGMTNRRGFAHGGVPVVADTLIGTGVVGTGLVYRLTPTWDAVTSVLYVTGRAPVAQPHTLFGSTGVRYTLRPPTTRRPAVEARLPFPPRRLVRIEYAHRSFGFGVNRLLSSSVPIFWGGKVQTGSGAALRFEQNIYHTERWVAVDLGVAVGRWHTRNRQEGFNTISVYPVLRLNLWRFRAANPFVSYSVAGPTFISGKVLDGLEVGTNKFTFQDVLTMGAFLGTGRRAMVALQIAHFSNGNLFARNAGIAVPLTLSLGYTF